MQTLSKRRPMDAVDLKTALIRAQVTQDELARRLGHKRGMVAGWVRANRVPAEWVPIVYEKLGLPVPPPALGAFPSVELLEELLDRERGVSNTVYDVDSKPGQGKNAGTDEDGGPRRGHGEGPPDL